jgi:hypothetical protein
MVAGFDFRDNLGYIYMVYRMRCWFILIAAIYLGCAGTKEVVKEEDNPQIIAQIDESFDPLTLNDDDIVIEGEKLGTNDDVKINDDTKIAVPKEINGFRVQILATKNIETASLFEQEASERFQNQDHKTYLIFEAPLYKIRVGDCKDRSEAELLRDMAKSYGYREAFIVKSKIQVIE